MGQTIRQIESTQAEGGAVSGLGVQGFRGLELKKGIAYARAPSELPIRFTKCHAGYHKGYYKGLEAKVLGSEAKVDPNKGFAYELFKCFLLRRL